MPVAKINSSAPPSDGASPPRFAFLMKETARRGLRDWFSSMSARFAPRRIESWFQPRSAAARNVRFHYDRSNDFYHCFLDSRMVYSCADFEDPGQNLDDAQLAKLDHVCRKLALRPEDRFLDLGCGWGALVIRAAEKREAERAGFEVLEVQNLRLHYALTCRRWVERLQKNREECLTYVDDETHRTWLLYLAASVVNFEEGSTGLCEILMTKPR